jgi:hypothetical protein
MDLSALSPRVLLNLRPMALLTLQATIRTTWHVRLLSRQSLQITHVCKSISDNTPPSLIMTITMPLQNGRPFDLSQYTRKMKGAYL